MKIILYLFLVLCSVRVNAQPRNFSCEIFNQILQGIKQQNEKIKLRDYLQDKVKVISDSSGMNPKIINISLLPDSYIDSLVKVSDFASIEDDPLFHENKKNIVIDTFNFFSPVCDCLSSSKSYKFIQEPNFSQQSSFNIIELRTILIFKEHFIVALKSRSSKSNVLFYFKIDSNRISLTKVEIVRLEWIFVGVVKQPPLSPLGFQPAMLDVLINLFSCI